MTSPLPSLGLPGRPSPSFSWDELVRGPGVDVTQRVPLETWRRLLDLAHDLELIRIVVGGPVIVTHALRVDGDDERLVAQGAQPSSSSRHPYGDAADIVAPGWTSAELAAVVAILAAAGAIRPDQVIAYRGRPQSEGGRGTHLHYGLWTGRQPRGEYYVALDGETGYRSAPPPRDHVARVIRRLRSRLLRS